MTFESLAVAGLSIGLSLNDILDKEIGLILSLLNERANQYNDLNNNNPDDEVIIGDAKMLMNM